ncbi:MAG TPA: hypothetical protein VNC50_11890, partial [Planctomycetia bacterium]|nr:hypothetical protein [Planctomycetia bacterium]
VWDNVLHSTNSISLRAKTHPLLANTAVGPALSLLRADKLKAFDGLSVVLDPSGRVIWRSDLHHLRPVRLPASICFALLSLFSFWRFRVAGGRPVPILAAKPPPTL